MPQSSKNVTARLRQDLVAKLDRAAHDSRRSRSEIVKEALEVYLSSAHRPPAGLMLYAGAGANLSTRRSMAQVDAEIRWLRDDE